MISTPLLHKTLHTLAAGLVVATLISCRTAREKDVFVSIDEDKDGRLTLTEVEDYGFKRMFNRFDTNSDGVISAVDGAGAGPNLMRKRDLNSDGKITFEEYANGGRRQGAVNKLFKTADANGDGTISPAETKAYLSAGGGAMLGD